MVAADGAMDSAPTMTNHPKGDPPPSDEEEEAATTTALQETTAENRYTTSTKTSTSTTTKQPANDSTAAPRTVFSPELLRMYYARLFPYHLLYSWLAYDKPPPSPPAITVNTTLPSENITLSPLFARHEFSFTLESDAGEEIYLRYKCFSNQTDLQNDIQRCRPRKIDIGAVFDVPPKDHKSRKITPEQREFVLDVDLTDYDGVRQCGCSGADICRKCWTLMTMAVRVMDVGLREDFGFQHVAWFYSGRRGVHAWVCDETARRMSNEARSAVATYFEVSLGSDKNQKVNLTLPLHPMLKRAHATLEPMFVQHILPASGHGLLATEEKWSVLLQSLPEAAQPVRDNLMQKWKARVETHEDTSPSDKWAELKKHLSIFTKKQKQSSAAGNKAAKTLSTAHQAELELWPVATVFRYTYPRLDINVSKMQNHLLKSPFCVHPKTGRVCVPIPVESVDKFDPFEVPTLAQLIQELDDYEEAHKEEEEEDKQRILYEWQKTSLKEHFEPFQTEFLEPMWKDLRRAQRDAAEEKAAAVGDF